MNSSTRVGGLDSDATAPSHLSQSGSAPGQGPQAPAPLSPAPLHDDDMAANLMVSWATAIS